MNNKSVSFLQRYWVGDRRVVGRNPKPAAYLEAAFRNGGMFDLKILDCHPPSSGFCAATLPPRMIISV